MILPHLTTEAGPGLAFARDFLAEQFRRSADSPPVPAPAATAEIMVRLALSFHLTPQGCIPTGDDADRRAFARTYLVPLLHAIPAEPR
ncbi:hypothetical protein [Actinomadura parmotrematis]|uniref:hypothetical protein n=1 Tax=Actinomadura parmotrematis TaxID=2864039 RepID=UPI0027E32C7F|nr:hypothetical protein [Actinomadura parmotrematis]